ncbi:glycosyltransferase [Stutzerimonas xanthomarina]|uniref:glycosyltransferase n=1 Tax=Stutzerimonas xanthomarina TaxID=271420 RepID=UPI003AA8F261
MFAWLRKKKKIHKYVLMRFNSNMGAYLHLDNNNLDWLRYRLKLASLTSFWSLRNQVKKDFTLIIVMNSKTPDKFLNELEGELAGIPYYIHLTDTLALELSGEMSSVIRKLGGCSGLIQTTRIDSDDMLAQDYLDALDKDTDLESLEPIYRYAPVGQQFSLPQEFREIEYAANAFGTLIEPSGDKVKTVYIYAHPKMIKSFTSKSFGDSRAMWCMAIHGANLLNQLRNGCKPREEFPIHPELAKFLSHPSVVAPCRDGYVPDSQVR